MRIRAIQDELTLRITRMELKSQSYLDEQAVTVLHEAILSGKTIRILDDENATYEFHVELTKGA